MKNKTALSRALASASIIVALLACPLARADEMADVRNLAKAGKAVEALNKANEYLSKHPADPQMRFMKGLLLTEQNKSDEAITVFTKLTEEFKDLPEPYNNLAVLYAAKGQYDKARVALEKAIRTNPSYMTAYENLGDIYGKMASQAYDKALALGSNNASLKSKLTLLRTFSSSAGSSVPMPAPTPQVALATMSNVAPPLISPLPAAPGKSTPPQRIPALSATPPAPTPVLATKIAVVPVPAKPVALAKVVPVPAPAAPAKPTPVPVVARVESVKPDTSDRDAVLAQVHGWAKAWTSQNVDSYLGYYSHEFEPPKGMSRKAWTDERRARIEGKGRIHVQVDGPEIVVSGNTAKVTFRQIYESDRLKSTGRKMLVLIKNGDKWQIKQEYSGR